MMRHPEYLRGRALHYIFLVLNLFQHLKRGITNAKNIMTNLITTSKAIALLSFVIGTILFAIQLYFSDVQFIYVGFVFVLVSIIANTISLITLIFTILGDSKNKLELAKTCGIILLNIPIAILYFYIIISIEFAIKG